MSERICQAATVRGRPCRKKAVVYHPHQGREVLLCHAHEQAAREGQLRLSGKRERHVLVRVEEPQREPSTHVVRDA